MSTALIFPGMGPSKFADVGKFMLTNPFARKRIAEAEDVLGYSVLDAFRESEHDYTEIAQIAFVINSVALGDWACETLGIKPSLIVGPSSGLRAATAFSGALTFGELVLLTADLTRWEMEYFARPENADAVTHSFVRTPQGAVRRLVAELAERDEWAEISATLDPDFFMVSVRERNLDWLKQRVRNAGGYSMYTMWPPVHATLFEPQRAHAAREIYPKYAFADPEVPLVADHDGSLAATGARVHDLHMATFVRPLHWPSVVETLQRHGITEVCVCGPDNLFSRLKGTANFEVLAVNPETALRPKKLLARRSPVTA